MRRRLRDDFGPPLPPAEERRRRLTGSSNDRGSPRRDRRDRKNRSRSRSRSPSSSRSSRRRRRSSSSRDRRRPSGSSSRKRHDEDTRSPKKDKDTRVRQSSKDSGGIKDLDIRSSIPNAESTPRVSKTKSRLQEADPFEEGTNKYDPFEAFGSKDKRKGQDLDTRRHRKDSDTRRQFMSTNPLAPSNGKARVPPQSANVSAPSMTLLCSPHKGSPISSDSSPNSESSVTKAGKRLTLPTAFDSQEYDSGEDDYDPANCFLSDHDSDENILDNRTNPTGSMKETQSSSSSMVMSPVTPPTEDEGGGSLKIDTGSLTDVSPKTMSDSGGIKPQAVVPPTMNADNETPSQPLQSLLTSQLSNSSSSLFAQAKAHQPESLASNEANNALLALKGDILRVFQSTVGTNKPVLDIVQNIAEIGKQLDVNKSINALLLSQEENKKSKRSRKSSSGRKETFKKRKDYQRAVVVCAKEAIKPFYKNRRIDKTQYKKIMKDCVQKIVQSSKSYTIDRDRVAQTVEKYVNKYAAARQERANTATNALASLLSRRR